MTHMVSLQQENEFNMRPDIMTVGLTTADPSRTAPLGWSWGCRSQAVIRAPRDACRAAVIDLFIQVEMAIDANKPLESVIPYENMISHVKRERVMGHDWFAHPQDSCCDHLVIAVQIDSP